MLLLAACAGTWMLFVGPSGAWAATPGEYVGETARGYELRMSVGDDGLVGQVSIDVTSYTVRCKQPPAYPGPNPITLLLQPPKLKAPFDVSTSTHFADTRRAKTPDGWRWKTRISGDLPSQTQWQGVYQARAKNRHNHVRCHINTTWTATGSAAVPEV